MRRSLALPSKTVRKYRSVSQRRMTGHDNDPDQDDDPKEMERLRRILAQSQAALQSVREDETTPSKDEPSNINEDDNTANPYQGILSDELVSVHEYGVSPDELTIMTSKKKKGKKRPRVELTPEEIKQAKQVEKQTKRKLKQLEQRKEQKEQRQHLYQKLQSSKISNEQRALLQPSATLGQTLSKKQQLRNLLQRERAGLTLTKEEHDFLYEERPEPAQDETQTPAPTQALHPEPQAQVKDEEMEDGQLSKKQRKKKKKTDSLSDTTTTPKTMLDSKELKRESESVQGNDKRARIPVQNANEDETLQNQEPPSKGDSVEETAEKEEPEPPISFAAQMMASLSTLKAQSTVQAAQVAEERQQSEERLQAEEELKKKEAFAAHKDYIPTAPIELKTAAALGLPVKPLKSKRRVVEVPNRPSDIQVARYELPVAAMEFEVMDTIRNNDVTIICGETGSGKSTQVPQFLYEAGLTLSQEQNDSTHYLIGITQPRRVAAVSTAKRVCYEMGEGDGQSIRGKGGSGRGGNLVAYQTRYETAGLGNSTHIKFMTDGILLQEIQSDLLLRKYSIICIDEAHERNLNSDALIGLLSASIPLRKQAAQELGSKLLPLKLVIMSATLRVSDFTENPRLFANASNPPAVLKIPGRTFPVTIHHSKITEIENYEDIAFQKVCKIHRKLPSGGILVFLTGKQEIVRMVRRLRRALSRENQKESLFDEGNSNDVHLVANNEDFCRDMDDDEVDGDVFAGDRQEEQSMTEKQDEPMDLSLAREDSNGPEKALILPLYSMLSTEEQAKVFQEVPKDHRLIVIATNIAETSITIPNIAYVVDTGRQKCRNFNSGTGVASYDIMWISKAAADQRAGRAGRTGPGHCYRLYSSSMYSRHMDDFALPEVLTRPLEDVVLAMKAMRITNVAEFPFPTPPGKEQLGSAIKLLANLGCVDTSTAEEHSDDGVITKLGEAVAKLPLGVRYGKMLLVAAEAGVLDYAIAMVAVLSESSPFAVAGEQVGNDDSDSSDDGPSDRRKEESRKKHSGRWSHRGGDVLAGILAVGAYSYTGRGAGGLSEKSACRKFCEDNGLHPVIMARIQKMRVHLARLAKIRLPNAEGVAARTGGILSSMRPPSKAQEQLLTQAIVSGLLDNVAMLAPLGSIPGEYSFSLRSAYLGCSSSLAEPLMMSRNSVVYSRDPRRLPKWICFDSIIRKTTKDGTSVATLKNITPIDPAWLGSLAKGSRLLKVGEPVSTPSPLYDAEKDRIYCSVQTKYGSHGWEIAPIRAEMYVVLQSSEGKASSCFLSDDSFRWFARYLMEGKVFPELQGFSDMWNDNPAILTRRTPSSKTALLVSALAGAGVDSAAALRKQWAEEDPKFLFAQIQKWIRPDAAKQAKSLWMEVVKRNIKSWKHRT